MPRRVAYLPLFFGDGARLGALCGERRGLGAAATAAGLAAFVGDLVWVLR